MNSFKTYNTVYLMLRYQKPNKIRLFVSGSITSILQVFLTIFSCGNAFSIFIRRWLLRKTVFFFRSCCLASSLTQQLRYFSMPTENPGTAGTYYSVSNIFFIDLVSEIQMNHSMLENLKCSGEWS